MKTLPILLGICLLLPLYSGAQVTRLPVTIAYTSMGAYSQRHADIFSVASNQASLAQLKNNAAGIYGERRFLLNELNQFTAVGALLTASGNFGYKAGYFGFSEYNETQLGLAYGRKLGSKLDAGAQFNYTRIAITGGYGQSAAISFEAGAILHLTDKVHTGFHINNPVGGKFGKEGQEKLAAVYTIGFGYEASEKFLVSAEIIKEEAQAVNVVAGVQYRLIPQVQVRAGMSTATSTAWFGTGFFLRSFRIDVTSSYHPQLGISPGILLLFNFKTKEK